MTDRRCIEESVGKKVSIIIVNWNQKENMVDCLESLKQIAYSDYEIIVVDNNSSDGSAETLQKKYPEVTLIKSEQNLGFAKASNIGARYALGRGADWVLFLNNDVIVDRFFLAELIEFLESHNDVGIVCPKIFFYDEPGKIWSKGAKISFPNIINIGANEEDCAENQKPQTVDSVTGCALLTKAEVLSKVGLFDESLFMIHEDLDLCIRTRKAGYLCYCVPSSRIWHRASSSVEMKAKAFGTYYFYRNWFLVVKRHKGGWMFVKLLLSHIFRIYPKQFKYLFDHSELDIKHSLAFAYTILDAVLGRTPTRYL